MAVNAALADIARRAAAGAVTGNIILKLGAEIVSGELVSRREFKGQWQPLPDDQALYLFLRDAVLHHGATATSLRWWCGQVDDVTNYALVGRDWELGPEGAALAVRGKSAVE